MQETVSAWIEKVKIPTYGTGTPEKNPIFLQKRVYQGSSGSVYPHPVIEKILDNKEEREYTAVFIENEFLRIMVLPELGGRIQRAYDKIRQRDFIYYNQVIKPALVGLTGPWISGGIEFNWPQHHRPSTFEPVDFSIEENTDGSKTVWVNEVELMTRTKGMAGFTLFPGKAYLQVRARLYNRTFMPQTFLWWANPAVKVNDDYQSVFPPDVHAVFDHGKRDVSDFPIATGTYYKVNYAPGTDISRYKNIPVPTSFMAVESKYDFIGCYEHDTQAGMLHVADHHVVPGKKQWTWGKGDFGIAWDRNLTDEDGPYIELMCGAFTDNQPDFSWLQPNEQKTFEQYFFPYAQVGLVKNATREAALNLEFTGEYAEVKVYATAAYPAARIVLRSQHDKLLDEVFNLSPSAVFTGKVKVGKGVKPETFTVEVRDAAGNTLVSYTPEKKGNKQMPPSAVAAKLPSELTSNELLFLNGLHLEQYRHATFSATDYYEEALRREPTDIRCNNAMGLWLLRRAQFAKAEPYFRKAIETLTLRNPNPYDGEPYYNLGVCLKMQGRTDEAFDVFYKSAWNDAMQHVAYLQLARIAVMNQRYSEALKYVDQSLVRNGHSHTARHLKVVICRKLGKKAEAEICIRESLSIDPFNYGCLFESALLNEDNNTALEYLKKLMHGSFNNYLEYAIDYLHAGCYEEAISLLKTYEGESDKDRVNPLLYYYTGYLYSKLNEPMNADFYYRKASAAKADYCFPSKIEDVLVLQAAAEANPNDARANYYLGNYWYANDQYTDAINSWEKSALLDPRFPTVQRNLSLAYHNKLKDVPRALNAMENAFHLDPTDARVLMELDQLHKLCNYDPSERLRFLEDHLALVDQRDDLYLERITLYNELGEYHTAKQLITKRKFHPWEGGEGKTVQQYQLSHRELAKIALAEGMFDHALQLLAEAGNLPHNLGEGKLANTRENDLLYLQGLCYAKKGLQKHANDCFIQATLGSSEPQQAIFYNDPQPDKIVYQGLAWLQLGEKEKASQIFRRLIEFGEQHLDDDIRIDYFAVSLPDLLVFDQDLNVKNKIHCIYLKALGELGLKHYDQSEKLFDKVLEMDVNHQGAIVHRNMISFLKVEATAV